MKLLYKAPLPFMGQKRYFIQYLPELLQGNLFDKGFSDYKNGIWVDMFGGSGLLSHNIKQIFPNAEVIYNDFDGYTNYLNDECVNILKECGTKIHSILIKYKFGTALANYHNKYICKLLNYYRNKYPTKFYEFAIYNFLIHPRGCVNEILKKNKIKNFKRFTPAKIYTTDKINNDCKNYLTGLNVIKGVDFKELIQQYKDNKNAVFVCDPPYLNSCPGNYKKIFDKNNFDFLVENIRPPFIAFSSRKNNLREILLAKFPNAKQKERDIFLADPKSQVNITDQMIWCVE